MKNFKIIILAAASGSGKGTFGQYHSSIDPLYVHIDAGSIVRSEIKEQTEVGKKIQPIYDSCKYLDESIDEIIWHELIENKLMQALEQNKIIVIDGCLRPNKTFDLLDKFIKNNNFEKNTCLLQFKASDKTCMKRISARRICSKCCMSYNILLFASKDKICNLCKNCNSQLELRKSDTKEFTKERLLHFHKYVEPILDKAKKHYEYIEIDTECEIGELQEKYKNLFCIKDNV